jgi:hypothetical protein
MSMKKTIEEIKAAVLAECERRSKIDNTRCFTIVVLVENADEPDTYTVMFFGQTIVAYTEMNDFAADCLYKLLGLEARDKVEAKDAEIRWLKDVNEGSISLSAHQVSEWQQLKAQNEALVEALEEIRKPAMITGIGRKATGKMRADQLEEDHKRVRLIAHNALENHKKGGVQTNHSASTLTQSQQSRIAQVRLAYGRIRTIDQTISDDILDLMKNAAIAAIKSEVKND